MEIVRERLIGRIAGDRITVVKAPSGFGKSTLIQQFLAHSPHIIACNLSVRHLDKYPGHFLRRFVAELRAELGDVYFVRTKTLVEEGNGEIASITQSFVKELAEVNRSFVIIVDGIDDLSDETTSLLKDVLRYSRDDIAFVFVTETDLDAELEQAVEWSYERISSRDLALTVDEISVIFKNELNNSEISKIHEHSGGWPFGVALLHRVWDRKTLLDSLLGVSWPEMDAFFSDKLYAPRTPSLKSFLLKSSLLDFVEPDIIVPVFGGTAPDDFSEAQSLQLYAAGDKLDYFVLQPLFAKYLEERAVQEIDAEDIYSFYTKIAGVYRERGNAFYAVYYAVKSGIPDAIDDIVIALFDRVIVFLDEEFRILADAIPEGADSKALDLLRAINVYRSLDYEGAKETFGKLWRSTLEDTDVIFGIAVWHYAYTLMFLRETDAEFCEIIGDWPEANAAASFVLMACTVDVDDRYNLDELFDICKKAIAIAEQGDNPNWLTALYCTMTSSSRSKERLADAAEYAEKSAATSKRRPAALKHLVDFTLDFNEAGRAAGYLKELELMERSLPFRFRYLVNAARGRFAFSNLKLEEAFVYFKRFTEQYLAVFRTSGKGEIVGDIFPVAALLGKDVPALIADFGFSGDAAELLAQYNPAWRGLLLYEFMQGNIKDKIEELLLVAGERGLPYSTGFLVLLRALSRVRDGDLEGAREDLGTLEVGGNEDLITRVTRKTLLGDDFELRLPGDVSLGRKIIATVNFLGGLTVKFDGQTLTEKDWEQRRALSLFAFLAKHRDETFTSERLIANMWPDADLDKGKQSLKTALKYIRGLLGDFGLNEIVSYSSKLYYLTSVAFGESDIEKLDDLIEAAEIAGSEGDSEKSFRFLAEAERMNRHDFLPNLYDDWADRYLHYYRILRIDTLERICKLLVDLGRREDFLSYSARLIMAAGNDETTQYLLEEHAAKLGVDIGYILNR